MRACSIRPSAASTNCRVTAASNGLGSTACRKLAISPGGLSTRHCTVLYPLPAYTYRRNDCVDIESQTHDAGFNRGPVKTRSSSADEALSALEVLRRENELLRRTIEAADGSISDLTSEVGLGLQPDRRQCTHTHVYLFSWSVLVWRSLAAHPTRTAQSLARRTTMIRHWLCGCPLPPWQRAGDWWSHPKT